MLSERQARAQGLHYTGMYETFQGKIKERILELRAKYPKAKFVQIRVPANPLSRGHSSGGYSIYADDLYSAYETVDRCADYEKAHLSMLAYIKGKYDKEIAEENERFMSTHEMVEKAKAIIAQKG